MHVGFLKDDLQKAENGFDAQHRLLHLQRHKTIEMFFWNIVITGALTHLSRFRPPTFHVQAWYDEVKDYSFPYPQECNPYCPFRCSGPVCTHYTQVAMSGSYDSSFCNCITLQWVFSRSFLSSFFQLVWATSSRIGCAINICYNMNVWGQIWAKAVYLVCNYSPK